jgi:hypothetical protein
MTQQTIQADATVPEGPVTGTAALWFGVLGAPAAWLIQFQLNYTLIPWACPKPWLMTLIRLATLLFLLGVLMATLVCWREWNRLGGTSPPPERERDEVGRTRFLGLLGMMSGALFFLIILGQGIATFMINPCWD